MSAARRLAGVTDGNDLTSVGRLWSKKLQDWAPDTFSNERTVMGEREKK